MLLAGPVVLWLLVNGLIICAARLKETRLSRWLAETLIVRGGMIFPLVTLGALLAYGLSIMPDQRVVGSGLTVRVTGHQ